MFYNHPFFIIRVSHSPDGFFRSLAACMNLTLSHHACSTLMDTGTVMHDAWSSSSRRPYRCIPVRLMPLSHRKSSCSPPSRARRIRNIPSFTLPDLCPGSCPHSSGRQGPWKSGGLSRPFILPGKYGPHSTLPYLSNTILRCTTTMRIQFRQPGQWQRGPAVPSW